MHRGALCLNHKDLETAKSLSRLLTALQRASRLFKDMRADLLQPPNPNMCPRLIPDRRRLENSHPRLQLRYRRSRPLRQASKDFEHGAGIVTRSLEQMQGIRICRALRIEIEVLNDRTVTDTLGIGRGMIAEMSQTLMGDLMRQNGSEIALVPYECNESVANDEPVATNGKGRRLQITDDEETPVIDMMRIHLRHDPLPQAQNITPDRIACKSKRP
ncbi:hypothetical protein D779_2687 [Imhoffiella purpurea]|uniref:Uncharacterized protein n=1 Tax=Imhoffiella purpurea TaxID=1249627 RepID=W9VC43_9GAMM|nr:hypothetical protein D779_2687 [Imhoffiella purpurea]